MANITKEKNKSANKNGPLWRALAPILHGLSESALEPGQNKAGETYTITGTGDENFPATVSSNSGETRYLNRAAAKLAALATTRSLQENHPGAPDNENPEAVYQTLQSKKRKIVVDRRSLLGG